MEQTISRSAIESYIKNYNTINSIGCEIIKVLAKNDPKINEQGYLLTNITEKWAHFRYINQKKDNKPLRIVLIPVEVFESEEARAKYIHKSCKNSLRGLIERFKNIDPHDSETLRIVGNDLCDVIKRQIGD